jgi:hypothetical protein
VPTRHFSRFDPTLTATLTRAFDRAWAMLKDTEIGASLDGSSDLVREALAKRIVEMADEGVTDVDELSVDALAYVQDNILGVVGRLPDSRSH